MENNMREQNLPEQSLQIEKLEKYQSAAAIFSLFEKEKNAVFLDSSLEGEQGRYSIIGRNPYLTVRQEQGTLYVNDIAKKESFEAWMGRYLKEHRQENPTKLPLISGAIGYFTYDYGRKYENIRSRHQDPIQMPEACFCFYDQFMIEDLEKREVYLISNGKTERSAEEWKELKRKIDSLQDSPIQTAENAEDSQGQTSGKTEDLPGQTSQTPGERSKACPVETSFTEQEYEQAVEKTVDYIRQGDVYIMNMTQQFRMKSSQDPYQVFLRLRTQNPSPFGGYFQYGSCQIVCASPERFLKIQDGQVETRPIKGTRKRGATPEEDAALKRELEESEKDRSELLMIVDLERNDLNRVCVPGSVRVTEHFQVEAYATVFHLVSTVVGQMQEEKTAMDVIEAAFPGGSITGAPKIRAMEIIDELERDSRGLYTGTMGYFSLDGNCDFNIVIRTAIHQNGTYYLGVGGGITCESDPEFEYEETLQKAKAVREAIGCE
jgi:para-aminobenzoate synthetase component 1